MDKNQDGFIFYKAEIKEDAEKYGAKLLGSKGQTLFEKLDATDNGNISMEGKKVLRNCT